MTTAAALAGRNVSECDAAGLPARYPIAQWTEERIEAELREFCRGRTSWPGHREFRTNEASGLYSAICRYGGTELWRKRLGLH